MKRQADPYGRGSYCIVVALHGDQSREAELLRNFRDNFLKKIPMGDKLIESYYQISPSIISFLNQNRVLQSLTSKSISVFANLVSFSRL